MVEQPVDELLNPNIGWKNIEYQNIIASDIVGSYNVKLNKFIHSWYKVLFFFPVRLME